MAIRMGYRDRRYQVGNYIKDWTEKIAKIIEIKEGGIKAEYKDGATQDLPWQDVYHLDITKDLLTQIGFSTIKEKVNPYHKEITAAAIINGRHYHMIGFIYEDKSLWTFNGISIRHFHQVQNILYIIEPSIDLQVQCSPL